MIFYIAWGLVTFAFLFWLWKVMPHRVDDWDYESTYDESGLHMGYKRVVKGKRWKYYFEGWWTGVLGVLGIIAAWVALSTILSLIFSGILNATIKDFSLDSESDTDLIALRTGSAVNGQFSGNIFLSAGYISEDPTFNFLYETSDNGVKVGQVHADNSVVYEDEQDAPYYTTFEWVKYDPFWAPFEVNQAETYAFHVPEGSVVSNYEVKP